MSFLHKIKQRLDLYLPVRHQWLLGGLSCVLVLVALVGGSQREPAGSQATNAVTFLPLPTAVLTAPSESVPATTVAAPASGELAPDTRKYLEVKPGDSLSLVFRRAGLSAQEVAAVTSNREHARVLSKLFPGNKVAFDIVDGTTLQSFELILSPRESWLLTAKTAGGYQLEHIRRQQADSRIHTALSSPALPEADPHAHVMIGPLVPDDYEPPRNPAATDTLQYLEVKPGDSLSLIFRRAGLGPQEVADVTSNRDHARTLTNLFPGNTIVFDITGDKRLRSLELIKTPLESYLLSVQTSGGYKLEHIQKTPEIRQVYRQATINNSLFLAAQRNDISDGMAMDMAGIFSGVVDFIQDTRAGDSFSILYEELYLNDQYIGEGRILAAEFINQGQKHIALRYENEAGNSNFFSPEGESMRKAFLLNPVDFTRISSGFTTSRKHPILNTIRAHKGTDYAAPKGTPIVATADGRVTFASRNGSFGKLVVIKHNDRFETKYAHLNDYGKGIKAGTRVRQGQIIGYVGATGSATGPHLHYEFLMDGVHRDSRRIFDQLPKAMALEKSEMERFKTLTQPLLASLTSHSQNSRLAMTVVPRGTGE